MPFVKGHPKYGGRKPGGTKAELNLKRAILEAFEAVDGAKYLEDVARTDPRTFCTLLKGVLPLQIIGDPNNPITHSYEVTLRFAAETTPLLEAKAEETVAVDVVDPRRLHWPEK